MSPRRLIRLLLAFSLLLFPLAPDRTAVRPAWHWPLDDPVVVLRGFDPPAQRWLPGHLGVDLAAEPGDQVYAAGPGRVHFAGPVAGTPLVSVAHGDLRTTYLPVDSALARGDPVEAGQVIGTVPDRPTHCADRPCLHWGLLHGSTHLDPLSLLGRGQVRLLPLGAALGFQDHRGRIMIPKKTGDPLTRYQEFHLKEHARNARKHHGPEMRRTPCLRFPHGRRHHRDIRQRIRAAWRCPRRSPDRSG